MGHFFQTFAEMDIKFSYITSCAQNAKAEDGTYYSLSHRYGVTKMQPFGNLLSVYAVSTVIPKFHQHLRFLLYNFDSFCLILLKFTPHLNQQTVHV